MIRRAMNGFLLVIGISALAAGLTFLGAPLAERFDVPHRIVSGALQFAAGIITALVAITLMPPAIWGGRNNCMRKLPLLSPKMVV